MKANAGQKAMIHVLKGKLHLPDDHYRDMLASFGVTSSASELFTHDNAKEFIRLLVDLCKKQGVDTGSRASTPSREFISPGQTGMVIGMWFQVSKQPSDETKRRALTEFIRNKWGISDLKWVPSTTVPKIVRTLRAMGAVHVK